MICFTEMYVRDIKIGTTMCDGKPTISSETAAVAFVDGNNLLGPVSLKMHL